MASNGDAVTVLDTGVATQEWQIVAGNQRTSVDAAVIFAGIGNTGYEHLGAVTTVAFGASPYTVLAADSVIYCDTSGGPIELDLPASAALGRRIQITNNGDDPVTIDGDGAETVGANQGGGATYELGGGAALAIIDTNVATDEWVIIGERNLYDVRLMQINVEHTAWTAAAQAETIAVYTVPDDMNVLDVWYELEVEFDDLAGPPITAADLTIGTSGGAANDFALTANVLTGAGAGWKSLTNALKGAFVDDALTTILAGADTITATLTVGAGEDVADTDQGEITIYVRYQFL